MSEPLKRECAYCAKLFQPDDENDEFCSGTCLEASSEDCYDEDEYDDEEYEE